MSQGFGGYVLTPEQMAELARQQASAPAQGTQPAQGTKPAPAVQPTAVPVQARSPIAQWKNVTMADEAAPGHKNPDGSPAVYKKSDVVEGVSGPVPSGGNSASPDETPVQVYSGEGAPSMAPGQGPPQARPTITDYSREDSPELIAEYQRERDLATDAKLRYDERILDINRKRAADALEANSIIESNARERRAADLGRQEAVRQAERKVEEARQWSNLRHTFATFFDGQNRLNAGILAAGLHRAGLHDNATKVLTTAMAQEYEGQKLAIQEAESEGRQAMNSLQEFRSRIGDETVADLAWEQQANQMLINRVNAAYATARTDAEKEALAVTAHDLKARAAVTDHMMLRSLQEFSTNPEYLQRNTMIPGQEIQARVQQNQTYNRLAAQADAAKRAIQAQTAGVQNAPTAVAGNTGIPAGPPAGPASNPPTIKPNGTVGYQKLDVAPAMNAVRGQGAAAKTSPGMAAPAPINAVPANANSVKYAGDASYHSPAMVQARDVLEHGKHTAATKVGNQILPVGYTFSQVDKHKFLVPTGVDSNKISEAMQNYQEVRARTIDLQAALGELKLLQDKWSIAGNLDDEERGRLRNAYDKVDQAANVIRSKWWKGNVDQGHLVKFEDVKSSELIGQLSKEWGQVGRSQLATFKKIDDFASRVRANEAQNLRFAMQSYRALPANATQFVLGPDPRDPSKSRVLPPKRTSKGEIISPRSELFESITPQYRPHMSTADTTSELK